MEGDTLLDPKSITVLGLFLTLISLLGTFFYVHLSNWYRDMLSLQDKWAFNRRGIDKNDDEEIKAMRECKYAIKSLYNRVPFMVAIVLSVFIGTVSVFAGIILIPYYGTDPLAVYLLIVFSIFLLTYAGLSIYFLLNGHRIGCRIETEVNTAIPAPKDADNRPRQ